MSNRYAKFLTLLVAAWFMMTFTHEAGHIAGGWAGGATLVDYDLAPWSLPYSIHDPDPNPRLTLWAGPVIGVAAPLAVAAAVRRRAARFVADFCLLANGSYLALGWATGDRLLDTPRMLAAGVSPLWIAAYCAATVVAGYARFRSDCVAILAPRPA